MSKVTDVVDFTPELWVDADGNGGMLEIKDGGEWTSAVFVGTDALGRQWFQEVANGIPNAALVNPNKARIRTPTTRENVRIVQVQDPVTLVKSAVIHMQGDPVVPGFLRNVSEWYTVDNA